MAFSQSVPPFLVRAAPHRELIRFRVLRDGVVTSGHKLVRVSRTLVAAGQADIGLESRAGEFTPWVDVLQQELADQSGWVVIVEDATAPAKVHAQALAIAAGGTYTINILTGSNNEVTEPGSVDAQVRVSGVPSAREVLIVERKLDGGWRVAGNGATASDGRLAVGVTVVDGAVYALGLDDFGIAFSAGLLVPVGRRVRPSVFAGVLYEITEAGALPANEPVWWPITTDGSRELGTARAVAVRYFQPIGHGPIPVEIL
jgi:hypothetical protein